MWWALPLSVQKPCGGFSFRSPRAPAQSPRNPRPQEGSSRFRGKTPGELMARRRGSTRRGSISAGVEHKSFPIRHSMMEHVSPKSLELMWQSSAHVSVLNLKLHHFLRTCQPPSVPKRLFGPSYRFPNVNRVSQPQAVNCRVSFLVALYFESQPYRNTAELGNHWGCSIEIHRIPIDWNAKSKCCFFASHFQHSA